MSEKIHEEGKRLIAEMLAGGARRIDGMYVEWASDPAETPGGDPVARCTREYFSRLADDGSGKFGLLRVRVSSAFVDDGLTVHFNALIARQALPEHDGRMWLFGVTLVSFGERGERDILVSSTNLDKPVEVTENLYTAVHAAINMGSDK